jgi:hypothetical protein
VLAETAVYYLSKQTVCIHKRLLLRNPLGISALVRDTLRPVVRKPLSRKEGDSL